MSDILSKSPELTRKAIEQAEAEAKRAAEAHDELDRVVNADTVAGRPAPPLSFARRLIIGRVAGDGEGLTDEDALVVCVFALFAGDVTHLAPLTRDRQAFLDAALKFADVTPADVYEQMARYAAAKLSHLATVSDGAGETGDGGPEGNVRR